MKQNIKMYKFDFNTILDNAEFDDNKGIVKCSKKISNLAREEISNVNDSLLFDYIFRKYGREKISEIIVIMDFASLKDKDKINKIKDYKNGFELYLGNNYKGCFVQYVKSNSMSRSFQCYYVNKLYAKELEELSKFGLLEDKCNSEVVISKWLAYVGLICSSAYVLSNIKLTMDQIAVIPDKELNQKEDCYTAVSLPYFYELSYTIKEDIKKCRDNKGLLLKEINKKEIPGNEENRRFKKSVVRYCEMLKCFLNSEDFENLSTELQTIIKEINTISDMNSEDAIQKLEEIRKKYERYQPSAKMKWEFIHVHDFNIRVNEFDGVGLISLDLAEQITKELKSKIKNMDELDHYSFQIRLPFVKGMVHACNFHEYCRENNIKTIKSFINFSGKEEDCFEYKDIENIKMILTESQFKAAKFLKNITSDVCYKYGCANQIEYYFKQMEKYDFPLAIANKDNTETFERNVNYQFLTTVPTDEEHTNLLIDHIKNEIKESYSDKKFNVEFKNNEEYSKLLSYLLNNYPDYFKNTKYFSSKASEKVENIKKEMLIGRFVYPSYRRYLAPDLSLLLLHAFSPDEHIDHKKYMNPHSFYAPKNEYEEKHNIDIDNQKSIILRNPHYSRNEIVILNRSKDSNSDREKYFGHLYGVVMIDAKTCVADRLGGADFDGDTVLIINEPNIASFAEKELVIAKTESKIKYKYNLLVIPALTESPKQLNYDNIVETLIRTFSNKIGKISNDAFKVSIDAYKENGNADKLAKYTIWNGLEIDSIKSGSHPITDDINEISKVDKCNLFLTIKKAIVSEGKTSFQIKKEYGHSIEDFSNEHIIYRIQKEILNNKLVSIRKSNFKIFKDYFGVEDDYSSDSFINACGIIKGVRLYINNIQRFKKSQKELNENLKYIQKEITEIIDESVVTDMDNFLNYFKTEDPVVTLENYLKSYFYYKKTNEEKEVILEKLNLQLPNEVKKLIFDFSDNGYKLLFLCLLYWKDDSLTNSQSNYERNIKPNNNLSEKVNNGIAIVSNAVYKDLIDNEEINKLSYIDRYMFIRDYVNEKFKDLDIVGIVNASTVEDDEEYLLTIFTDYIMNGFKRGDL